jgi:hypothetical protein
MHKKPTSEWQESYECEAVKLKSPLSELLDLSGVTGDTWGGLRVQQKIR